MKIFSKKDLIWIPRILTIIFAIFLSLFALDVFEENIGFLDKILAFLIHLIPTFIILIILVISFKWEWVSGAFYFILGFIFLFISRNKLSIYSVIFIFFPLIFIGILFLLNWFIKIKEKK